MTGARYLSRGSAVRVKWTDQPALLADGGEHRGSVIVVPPGFGDKQGFNAVVDTAAQPPK